MSTRLNPYLSFKDNAREAMQFYQSVFGGELTINYFKEYKVSNDPSEDDKVMHAELAGDNGIQFMAADTPNGQTYNPGTNIAMALFGENEAELRAYFNKLSAGGTINQPLEKAPWGDSFGMLSDKFGIDWMVNIAGPKA